MNDDSEHVEIADEDDTPVPEDLDLVEVQEDEPEDEEGTEEVEIPSTGELEHKAWLIAGTKGCGKTTLALHIAKRCPYVLFWNPQDFDTGFFISSPELWKEHILKFKHIEIRPTMGEVFDDFVREFHEWTKQVNIEDQIMLVVDESASYGIGHVNSSPFWSKILTLKHRLFYNYIIICHSIGHVNKSILDNQDLIILMRCGTQPQEWKYITGWYPELEEWREELSKKYYFVIINVTEQTTQGFNPIGV